MRIHSFFLKSACRAEIRQQLYKNPMIQRTMGR